MLATVLGLLSVGVCVALNAFFVAAEFALVTIRHTWVEELVRAGHPRAPVVKRAIEKLDDSIAATQLGITLASIALGWLGEPAIARSVAPLLHAMGAHSPAVTHTISIAIAFSLITFLHVVLGELAPKAVALGSPEKVALLLASPLLYFSRAFRPVIWAMNGVGNFIVRRFGFEPATGHARVHTVGELKMLVEETHDAGELDRMQAEVVGRTLDLRRHRVRDVMVDRANVCSIDLESSEREVLEKVYAAQYTRMPVWSRRRGRYIGIANTKLLMLQHLRHKKAVLHDVIYEPLVFHHAAPLGRALRAFKASRQHMAFVAGDDGAQIGIVTLEDVLEALVGAIDDELDVNENDETPSRRMSRASLERADRPSLH